MKLHDDQKRFLEAIMAVSESIGVDQALVEKDYFITLFLKKAVERIPGLVFKGGTSLSKCYHLIDRFSEDIDLTLDDEHYTQAQKRSSIRELVSVCDELGLELINKETIKKHTHGNFNRFDIRYPKTFHSEDVKPELSVEMAYIQKCYPCETSQAISYIGAFFVGKGSQSIVAEYELGAFGLQVQTLERTFVDKVFAICDYYLSGNTLRTSRHIYDISKLLTKINIFDSSLKSLVENVKNDRKSNRICLSAQDGESVPRILKEIVATDYFKKDYDETTLKLLTKTLSYDEAIKSLQSVIDSGLFGAYNKIETS